MQCGFGAVLAVLLVAAVAPEAYAATSNVVRTPGTLQHSNSAQFLQTHKADEHRRRPGGGAVVDDPWANSDIDADAMRKEHSLAAIIVVATSLIVFFLVVPILVFQCVQFCRVRASEKSFRDFLWYRFTFWFATTPGAQALLLTLLTLTCLLVGAALLSMVHTTKLDGSLWQSWLWLAAPDGGVEMHELGSRAVAIIVNIAGLVIFALLVSMITDNLSGMIDEIKTGSTPIVEGHHTVVVGATDQLFPCLQQLDLANMRVRGTQTIAVLANMPKEEVEDQIASSDIELRNSVVVVRPGRGYESHDLLLVAADAAKTILILGDGPDGAEADSRTIRTLLCLSVNEWPQAASAHVTAQCLVEANVAPMSKILGDKVEVVVGDMSSQLMVQCTRHPGLSKVYDQVFGFQGLEFGFHDCVGLVNKTFREAAYYLPHGIAAGLVHSDGEMRLNPPAQTVITDGDSLVLVAAGAAVHFSRSSGYKEKDFVARRRSSLRYLPQPKPAETILLLGWNNRACTLLSELDSNCSRGSEVLCVSATPTDEREAAWEKYLTARSRKIQNIKLTFQDGHIGSRKVVDSVYDSQNSIFVLAEESADDPDAQTVAALILIDQKKQVNKSAPYIVPQIVDSRIEEQLHDIGLNECIDTTKIIAQTLAMVAVDRRLHRVLTGVAGGAGCEFRIRKLQEYTADMSGLQQVSFFDLHTAVASQRDEVVVGWVKGGVVEMNPPHKARQAPWNGEEDQIIVLSGAACSSARRESH